MTETRIEIFYLENDKNLGNLKGHHVLGLAEAGIFTCLHRM